MNKLVKDYLASNHEVLKNIIQSISFPIIIPTQNVFHDIISCVFEQQIHYRSSKKIFQKILDRASITQLTTDNFSIFEEKGIGNVKLSIHKFETIGRLYHFFDQNKTNWSTMTDDEIRQSLSQIKGIGNWTIDMILLYTLERPNIFPADDYHLKKIMTRLYAIDSTSKMKNQLHSIAEKWSPYQSFAVMYLLDWKEMLKRKGGNNVTTLFT